MTHDDPTVIDHELLLQKLTIHGVENIWFAAYLRGHTQSVSLNDGSRGRVLSRPLPNDMGVFQSSALGPLLFTVFSNNLFLYAGEAEVFQYADDTQVLVSGPASDLGFLISRMEASLASLNDWFSTHALKVNASKTQLMVFGSRPNLRKLPEFNVSFRDAVLQPCEQVRNLGLHKKLGWLSPKAIAEHQTLVMAHKIMQRGEPEDLAALSVRNRDARERHTRQNELLLLPRPQLETGKRRFGYRAASLMNSLPAQVVHLRPVSFARAAREALVDRAT